MLVLSANLDHLKINCPVCGHEGEITYVSCRLPLTVELLCATCSRYRFVKLDPRSKKVIRPDLEELIDEAEARTDQGEALSERAA